MKSKLKSDRTIILLGASGTGKTYFIDRYVNNAPANVMTGQTIGVNFINKSIDINGRIESFLLMDTAGQ